jgi:DNA end-binding protein Ku
MWKGFLRLSLVACPVKLYSATSSSEGKISFNLLHKDTHNRVSQTYKDPELGEVSRSDLVKGYQFDKDRYVVILSEELDAIEIESSKTIDIDGFFDSSEIEPIYQDSTYYLAPDGFVAEETFAVMLEAMRRSGKVGIARITLSGRERLMTLQPIDNGFKAVTLRAAKEVRDPSTILEPLKAKIPADALSMAEMLIAQKEGHFDPSAFEDRYETALMELVQSKVRGGAPVIAKAPERGNVVNLMDALKRSIEEERRPPAPSLGKSANSPATKATPAKAAAAKPAPRKKGVA